MANVDPLERADLPEFEQVFELTEAAMGFVPRSMLTMARMPGLLPAFSQLAGTVIGPGSVDAGTKQLVAHVASSAAGCRYCQAHTASSAVLRGVDADKAAVAWEFETNDRFTAAERAALRLARDASTVPNASTRAHFDELGEHFDDQQITEIVAVISLFGFLNRWNDTMATELEEEPTLFAQTHLADSGWDAGKHAHSP